MNLYLIKARKYVLISCLAFIGTALFAQNNERITIKSNNITLKKALTEIENQSKPSVFYCPVFMETSVYFVCEYPSAFNNSMMRCLNSP